VGIKGLSNENLAQAVRKKRKKPSLRLLLAWVRDNARDTDVVVSLCLRCQYVVAVGLVFLFARKEMM
jgi:hypothetical protein